jgi:hypothetical protein
MSPEHRRQILLAGLVVVLTGAVYVEWPRTANPVRSTSNSRSAGAPRTAASTLAAPTVHLKSLEEAHATPGEVERNLFKFKAKPAPPPPTPAPMAAMPPPIAVPSGPPPPPPVPPIGLKFVGILEPANTQKIAILSDGRGAPLYGKEGETVLGQFRILRIGVESIEMSYLDGRGRQTIRLSGL